MPKIDHSQFIKYYTKRVYRKAGDPYPVHTGLAEVYLASAVEPVLEEVEKLLEKVAQPDQGAIQGAIGGADPDPIRILAAVLTVMNQNRDEANQLLRRLRARARTPDE